jgi:hypothetical protein
MFGKIDSGKTISADRPGWTQFAFEFREQNRKVFYKNFKGESSNPSDSKAANVLDRPQPEQMFHQITFSIVILVHGGWATLWAKSPIVLVNGC